MPQRIKARLELKFEEFLARNPKAWELFVKFSNEAIAAGVTEMGVALIIERIRWETTMKSQGVPFKISNSHRAYFARKFMEDFPEHAGLFRIRPTEGDKLGDVVGTMLS